MVYNSLPFDLSFCGNPMRVQIDIGATPGVIGQRSVNTLTITDIDTVEDHAVTVAMMDQEFTFTLKDTPADPTDLPTAQAEMLPSV